MKNQPIKRIVQAGIVGIVLLLIGCAGGTDRLAQVSTLSAVMGGDYDGRMSLSELGRYGDMGLGTFDALDGEMICVDGRFYRVRTDGKCYRVSGSETTPFANVAFFRPEQTRKIPPGTNYAALRKIIESMIPCAESFYAIRIDGTFRWIRTRSVPRQKRPYPPFLEVVKKQTTFDLGQVRGTMVGFYFPAFAKGVNVVGCHFHFLTASRTAGGHVLTFETDEAVIAIDRLDTLLMMLQGGGEN